MKTFFVIAGIGIALGLGVYVYNTQRTSPSADTVTTDTGMSAVVTEAPAGLQTSTTTPVSVSTLTTLFNGSLRSNVPVASQTYTSPFGFSFMYDSRLQIENSTIVLPGGARVSALALVRYVEEQHCGMSGLAEHCRPLLENPALAFGVIDQSPKDVVFEHLDAFAQNLESVSVNGIIAGQYYAGVEGEGVVTMLIPINAQTQTLLIQYTYDTLFDDDTNPATLTAAQQKIIVDSVLNTLKVQ